MGVHVSFEEEIHSHPPAAGSGFQRLLAGLNHVLFTISAVALLAASAVMTYGVGLRYFAGKSIIWQDEVTIFLLVGATFLSAASVQARRGHVGIEAIGGILSPAVNRFRLFLADVASLAFVAFFTWKSWALAYEAWHEGHVSESAWGPPMWIPYLLMSLGMTLLTLQILAQLGERFARPNIPVPAAKEPLAAAAKGGHS